MRTPVERWSSPWRALLWKEWRQQWWLFAAMFVLPAGTVPVARSLLPAPDGLTAGLLVWLGLLFAVAANAFAGEQDDGTSQFLRAQAVDRWRVYVVKLATVVGFSALGAAPVLILGCRDTGESPQIVLYCVGPGLGAVLAAASVSALVATLGARTLATFLAAPVLALGVLLPCGVGGFRLYNRVGLGSLSFVVLLWIELALLGFGAAAIWCWREDRLGRRVLAVAALAVLGGTATVPPAVATWGWILCVADPTDYDGISPELNRSFTARVRAQAYASPDGHYVAMEWRAALVWRGGWGRIAIADTASGEARWHQRFQPAVIRSGVGRWSGLLQPVSPWSPDGRAFLCHQSPRFLWPLPWPYACPYPDETDTCLAVIDRATGTGTRVPGEPKWWHWCGPATLANLATKGGVDFYHWPSGDTSRCSLPSRVRSSMDLWTTSHGLFRCWPEAVEGSGMRLRVLRAAPDLAKAEEKPVEGVWTRPAVRSVADDGRWLLVEEEPYDNPPRPDRFSLVSLADGRTHPIAPPAGVELDRAVGFLAGERGLLFDTPDGLRLFAPRTDRWCLLHPRGVPASCNVYGLSASPSGRYLAYWDDETYVWWCVDLDDPTPVIGSPDPATVPAHSLDWLGDDRLLLLLEDGWWIVNRDGTGKRRLLPRD